MTIERMKDRCSKFCGDKDTECFAHSKRQLNCLADIIVNKAGSISMLMGHTLEEGVDETSADVVEIAYSGMNELTNWIQYLMIVGDMRQVQDLVLGAKLNKNRSEIRYPVPIADKESIKMQCNSMDSGPMAILNFSQTGTRFVSSCPFAEDETYEFTLLNADDAARGTSFKARVMHCVEVSGEYQIGAKVIECSGSKVFNFFGYMKPMLKMRAIS